jgi:hypothetical protein
MPTDQLGDHDDGVAVHANGVEWILRTKWRTNQSGHRQNNISFRNQFSNQGFVASISLYRGKIVKAAAGGENGVTFAKQIEKGDLVPGLQQFGH